MSHRSCGISDSLRYFSAHVSSQFLFSSLKKMLTLLVQKKEKCTVSHSHSGIREKRRTNRPTASYSLPSFGAASVDVEFDMYCTETY